MIDDIVETHSTQTIDDYTLENDYELNDIINFSSPLNYYEYPQEIKNFEIELGEDYSMFKENLNDSDYDYMIDDHSIPIFDEYSQKSDDDYMIKNDSPPIFDDYNNESEEFNKIEKESSPLFEDRSSENEYMEIEILENHMPLKFDEYSLEDECDKLEIIEKDSYNEKENEYYEVKFI